MKCKYIVRKELVVLARDRRALAILVIMPLVFIAILGFSTGQLIGTQNDRGRLCIAVVDCAGDDLASEVLKMLDANAGIRMVSVAQEAEANRLVDVGEVELAIIIDASFSDSVRSFTPRQWMKASRGTAGTDLHSLGIRIYHRNDRTAVTDIAVPLIELAVLKSAIGRVVEDVSPAGALSADGSVDADLGEHHQFGEGMSKTKTGEETRPNLVYQIIVPGYAVMFAFFLINIMARSFIAERQEGTMLRLAAAPLSAAQLVMGKTVPFLLISVFQGVLLFVFGKALFSMSWGPYPCLLFPVICCTSIAATGLGLVVAVMVRTDSQVSAYGNLLVITLAGVSGCFMPRSWLPPLMRDASLVTPHSWSLIAFDQLLVNATPNIPLIVESCFVLLGMGTAFVVVGCCLLKQSFRLTRD